MKTFKEWLKLHEASVPYVLQRPEGPIHVVVHVSLPSRGPRDSLGGQAGMGPPLEPDEDLGIEGVEDEQGNDIEITDAEHEEILQFLSNQGR